MEMNIKDINLIIQQYDERLSQSNREVILITAYAKELEKELKELKEFKERFDKDNAKSVKDE